MFEYVHCQPHLVAVAGRALHNYPNPKVHAHQPQLVFLSDEHTDFQFCLNSVFFLVNFFMDENDAANKT
jgi:hypothetical protein